MTWIELAEKLRSLGVDERVLPSMNPGDQALGLRIDGERYIVYSVDRTTPTDYAEFRSESDAAAYAYDMYLYDFALLGDERGEKFLRGEGSNGSDPSRFGGRVIQE
jgi:hypothetical protein